MALMRQAVSRVCPKMRMLQFQSFCTAQSSDGDVEENLDRPLVPALTGERAVNKVLLIGRVGRDPEVRGSEEKPVTLFSMATSASYKRGDGSYKQFTEWHKIAIFRPVLRDLCFNNVRKGDKVYVSGAIRYGSYEDSEGKERQSTTIVADDVIFLKKAAEKV